MTSKRAQLAKLALQPSPSGLSSSEFTLQNYLTENQEAGLSYVFNGSPISDLVPKFSPNPAQSALDVLKATYSDGEELQPEVGARFSFLMVKDRKKFITALLGNINGGDKSAKVRAQRGLISLLGVKHDPPAKMELSDAEVYYTNLLASDVPLDDSKAVLTLCETAELKQETPPVEALAFVAGADRPWVRSRLQKSLSPNVWYMANVANFNTSPKDMFEGFLNLAKEGNAKNNELKHFYNKIWERPDFVSFMRTKEAMSVKDESGEQRKELKEFLAFSSLLDAEPGMNMFEILAREFDVYQPSFFVVSDLRAKGMTDSQAELRAAFAERLASETDQRKIDAAARRLLGLTYPAEPIIGDPRTSTIPPIGSPSLFQRFNAVVSKFVEDTKSYVNQPAKDVTVDEFTVEADGFQSWEEKDQAIQHIESKLEEVMLAPTLVSDSDFTTVMPVSAVPETAKEPDTVKEAEPQYDSEGPPLEELEVPQDIER